MSEPPHDSLKERTRFDPAEVEPRMLEPWLECGRFDPEPEGAPDEDHAIAFPPPRVTGDVQMGLAGLEAEPEAL